jgi:hypothetical protein
MSLTNDNYFFRSEAWWFSYDKTSTYNESGELHSYADKPALVFRNSKGRVYREEWYYNGLPHREGDKPAVAVWYCDTVKISLHTLEWYTLGKMHRDKCVSTGMQYPAKMCHRVNGKVFLVEYYAEGECHNLNGPAIYTTVDNGLDNRSYYIFGRKYTYKEYIKQKFIFNTIKNRVRMLRRKILATTLKTTTINTSNGPDICNLISSFVY